MKIRSLLIGTATSTALLAGSASAKVVIAIEEVGDDVIATLSGTYDVSALVFPDFSAPARGVLPAQGILNFGPAPTNGYDFYSGVTGPANFGLGGGLLASSGTGDLFSLNISPSGPVVGVEAGTTMGSVSGVLTFDNQDFNSMGLAVGAYDWIWQGDSAELTIGNPAAVPLPAGLPLLALSLVGLGAAARRAKRK